MAERAPAAPAATLAPVLALVLNALVWGLSWWPLRALQAQGLHPLWSTALVYALALALLTARAPHGWRLLWRTPGLWALALAAGLTNLGFNWATTVGDVVRVVLLFYLMPAWSTLLAWWLLDERPSAAALGRLALALVGMAIVLHQPGAALPWPSSLPDWLALGAGASFALTNVLLRRLAHTPSMGRAFAMFSGGAATACAVALAGAALGFVTPWPAAPVHGTVMAATVLGLTAVMLLANLALQYGAARLPVRVTTLVMLSEVVFAAVSSIALGAAEPTPRVWLGGALVMAAALWAAQANRTA